MTDFANESIDIFINYVVYNDSVTKELLISRQGFIIFAIKQDLNSIHTTYSVN